MINELHLCLGTAVMPTVYSDSLSYYEDLCKCQEKINEIIKDINSNLSDYIDRNFNKLMVNAIYDSENETILLKKELISSTCLHTYSNDTLKIG